MNENHDEVKRLKYLVKEHYNFLVEEHNFEFDDREYVSSIYHFTSDDIDISIQIGRDAPTVIFRRMNEPESIYILLNAAAEFLRLKYPGVRFDKNSREDNIRLAARQFEKIAPRILAKIDNWWVPLQHHIYKELERHFKSNDQLADFLNLYNEEREYLKGKGVIE